MTGSTRRPRLSTPGLIYDVGMHNGDDTAFYLHQGYRVVAIEADPGLAAQANARFASELQSGRLTILNIGIAETSGFLPFWIRDDCSIWNSFDPTIAGRNGGVTRSVVVRTATFGEILDEWGIPDYLKIDIERNDELCVEQLAERFLPTFISVESECVADDEDLDAAQSLTMLKLLHKVGYRRFKLIYQEDFSSGTMSDLVALSRRVIRSAAVGRLRVPGIKDLARQLTPERRLARRYRYDFPYGSSGPWGDAAMGRWLSFEQAERVHLKTRRRHFAKIGVPKFSFWYDWHATL